MQDADESDLVLSMQRVADMSGVEFLREMRISHPEAIRILITGPMDHDEMVRSINEAAVYQIVPMPWNAEHMHLLVRRALESRELARRHRYLSRRDLYYRLRGFELNIPPLRERVEDIAVLADHAAHKYAESLHKKIAGISADVLQRLKVHPFPGNVRELENECGAWSRSPATANSCRPR